GCTAPTAPACRGSGCGGLPESPPPGRRIPEGRTTSSRCSPPDGCVGLRGLEPLTSSLSAKRSNRLSYRPVDSCEPVGSCEPRSNYTDLHPQNKIGRSTPCGACSGRSVVRVPPPSGPLSRPGGAAGPLAQSSVRVRWKPPTMDAPML